MARGATQGAAGGAGTNAADRRIHHRLAYTVSHVTVAVMHPGGTLSKFLVACRDLSAGGIAFLHRGFLYNQTECQIYLPTLTGGDKQVRGQVVRCSHIKKNIHEIGVAFDEPIDPRQFMDVGVEYAELNDKPIELPELQGRLLYVGVSPLDFSLLKHQLQGTGLELAHCPDPERAVHEARRTAVDIILCELLLGEMSGEQVIVALRQSGCRAPIIASTAERDPARLRKIREFGGNAPLLKPYSPATLISLLSQHLENRPLLSVSNEPIYSTLPADSSLTPLITEYVNSVKSTAAALRQITEADDLAALRRTCVELQGSGASYGFQILTEVAGETAAIINECQSVNEVGYSLEKLLAVCDRLQVKQAA